ncbi:MAG: methyltransferase [Croceibacterium sp.]
MSAGAANGGFAAQGELRAMLAGYWRPHAAVAAVRLGVADAMPADGSDIAAGDVATAVGADPVALNRFLRALSSIGLVRDCGAGHFALTPVGACLRGDHPQSLKGMALHVGTRLSPAMANLHLCVRDGHPPAGVSYGPGGFAELKQDAVAAAIFNQSMADNSRRIAGEAAAAYDFTRFGTIIDVGGGYGAVLAQLLKAAPAATGSVLDLEHAREGAEKLFAAEGLADRAHFTTASFFEPFPEQADAYVLKYILHDWDEDHARRIVAQLGDAARASNGTVVIIEKVMPEQVEPRDDHAIALQGDMTMMLWNGCERTEAGFADLLAHGGLALTATVPLADNHYVIEARPAA